ncbi:response regulator transcription factor [Prosthecobacter sp.]|uniref:response regulator transcription factor n=1 Tax=Prosthecobacter sp. TaxID=1965333 RepID=UPI0025EAF759|nr:response regulator transcription factor [Prosthecobacter sp.]
MMKPPASNQGRQPETGMQRRVLLVEDHPIFRKGIAMLLQHEPDLIICGEAETASHALELVDQVVPDIVVADITLKDTNGIELVKALKAMRPEIPVLVLSMHEESLYAERALRAGARGYLMKQAPPEQVVAAIRQVLRGELYLSASAHLRMLNTFITGQRDPTGDPVSKLSDRELEVFELLGKGHGTSMIAQELRLSVKTIEAHRAHIKTKLGLTTAPELMRAAVEWMTRKSGTPH